MKTTFEKTANQILKNKNTAKVLIITADGFTYDEPIEIYKRNGKIYTFVEEAGCEMPIQDWTLDNSDNLIEVK